MGETLSGLPVEVVLFFAGIVTLLFLIVVISLWVKMNKLRKSYQKMLNGSGSLDVEQVLIDLQNRCNDQSKRMDLQEQTILAMPAECRR